MIYSPELNLSSLINEIIKVFSKNNCKDLEDKLIKIANENHVIVPQEEIARKDFIPNLEYSLDNITGELIISVSIITQSANPMMAKIHNIKKRQPVILLKENRFKWLDSGMNYENILDQSFNIKLINKIVESPLKNN